MKNVLLSIFCLAVLSCASRTISENEKVVVLKELKCISEIDQKYAGIPPKELFEKYGEEKGWQVFISKRDSVGDDNQQRIKKLYDRYGYLGFDKVGSSEADFWISIQHADDDVEFQKKMLKALRKEIRRNNAPKLHYAMLEDRIAINTNQKQRFGSQVAYNQLGQAVPKNGLIDSAHIEQLRKQYDMPSFKKYYNDMTIMHYEMNKENLNKKGIHEPQLYK
ncbi:hypothetical protein [uncultured Chryseobacterium sp.]|uniref:hypothetical protein n=1 Tax=uncultured Chryseobacterium sp. TaxID=259322 RepID=UPI0025ED8534|nr:hypothetical protein [uncultured Chryseobacterium sp.]